jgi:hypothetical protein
MAFKIKSSSAAIVCYFKNVTAPSKDEDQGCFEHDHLMLYS